MVRSILVPLSGTARDTRSLATALAVARPFGAHLDCLHVRPDPRLLASTVAASMETGLGTGTLPAEVWETLAEGDKKRAAAARTGFDAFAKRNEIKVGTAPAQASGSVSAHYRELEGDPARDITFNARYADLVVFAREAIEGDVALDPTGDVILASGKPILLAPESDNDKVGNAIAIAWKDTAESARAVTAAMPLLGKAKDILVLCVPEGAQKPDEAANSAQRLVGLLRLHGLPARTEPVVTTHGAPDAVVEHARAQKCDLLVMGAYGHSRMREFVLGGFTRHVLRETRLPILLLH